ncbi:hypothetical protein [Polyangium mundeleinium]|uniref:DivIVA domain-containing protein n=1 Tax=Polyangium mundeleinium TaxID=2995306 RepID=A0ABT5EPG4_9BACT|nr:hypothetical protein [Polyangium mundeleinium]MDC0742660.1 hypothetical protein [Polyangium mundeleinium]
MPPEDSDKSRSVRGSMPGAEIHVLAKTMFRDFMNAGYQARDVITFATELLDLVIASLRQTKSDTAAGIRKSRPPPGEEGK